ncbi:MAG: hypothetical protein KKE20_07185 [Nanoarchaeota archaeon]|nr:hypothetical protein [Nanoarchaeota archaeon]
MNYWYIITFIAGLILGGIIGLFIALGIARKWHYHTARHYNIKMRLLMFVAIIVCIVLVALTYIITKKFL